MLATASRLLLLLLLLLFPLSCHATITVLATGTRYASRQDRDIGKPLWHGYVYEARLQYLYANPWLCNPDDNNPDDDNNNNNNNDNITQHYNITAPPDGVPVALLVRGGGGCSVEEKARFALDRVFPKGIVRFLIVGSGRKAEEDLGGGGGGLDHVDYLQEQIESSEAHSSEEWNWNDLRYYHSIEGNHEVTTTTTATLWSGDSSHSSKERHHRHYEDEPLPLTILHVSMRTEQELLLDVLRTQKPAVEKMGGTKVNLDGRLGTGVFDSEAAVWVAVSALLSACACSAILLANGNRQGWWEPDMPEHHPPVRPQRRCLTREQVKAMFPRYLYEEDGTLRPLLEEADPEAAAGEGMQERRNDRHRRRGRIPELRELDVCSICLDDYEVGDKIRCLPCHHAFHAKCIGKWLSERSATCPLCKTELHEDDDASSSDESEAAPTEPPTAGANAGRAEPTGSWWDRLHALARAQQNVTVAEPLVSDATTTTTTTATNQEPNTTRAVSAGDEQQQQTSADFPRSSWWRRMFPTQRAGGGGSPLELQSVDEQSAQAMLAEPLLQATSHDAETLEQGAAAAEEEEGEGEIVLPITEEVISGIPPMSQLETRQVTI